MRLALSDAGPAISPISPRRELGAYEALWLEKGATFRSLAAKFAGDPNALPSDFVQPHLADLCATDVMTRLKAAGVHQFGVRIHHAGDYPTKLRVARHPVEMLYYRGIWEISETRGVAVVGNREASQDGIRRAIRLARELVDRGFTVVWPRQGHRCSRASGRDRVRRKDNRSRRHAARYLLPQRKLGATRDNREKPPADLSSASAALWAAGTPAEPPVLPRAERDNERAD